MTEEEFDKAVKQICQYCGKRVMASTCCAAQYNDMLREIERQEGAVLYNWCPEDLCEFCHQPKASRGSCEEQYEAWLASGPHPIGALPVNRHAVMVGSKTRLTFVVADTSTADPMPRLQFELNELHTKLRRSFDSIREILRRQAGRLVKVRQNVKEAQAAVVDTEPFDDGDAALGCTECDALWVKDTGERVQ